MSNDLLVQEIKSKADVSQEQNQSGGGNRKQIHSHQWLSDWMELDNLCLLSGTREHLCLFCSGPFIKKFQKSFLKNAAFFNKKVGTEKMCLQAAHLQLHKRPPSICGLKFMAQGLVSLDSSQTINPGRAPKGNATSC